MRVPRRRVFADQRPQVGPPTLLPRKGASLRTTAAPIVAAVKTSDVRAPDFQVDATSDGHACKMASIVDEDTCEAPG